MDMNNFILHELTDEEINKLTDDEIYEIGKYYDTHPLPKESTIRGLLEKYNISTKGLTDFILGFNVGVCNHANRTENQIYISRQGSPLKDNIVINLNNNNDLPCLTVQIQISEDFIHEEAYTRDGGILYQA